MCFDECIMVLIADFGENRHDKLAYVFNLDTPVSYRNRRLDFSP